MAEDQKLATPTAGDSVPETADVAKETPEPSASEKKDEGAEAVKDDEKPAEAEPSTGNGESEKSPEATEESKPADTAESDKPEGEKESVGATDEAGEQGTTNGTPAANTKKASGKRKSTGAAGAKKLTKKKSTARMTHLDAQPGEYYFARMKGFAPWPAVICDEEMLPESILGSRPTTAKQPDGTYKELYADGGKRVIERTFPIMYLHTNEFAWIKNTDLSPLDPEQCKDVSEKGKSKPLIEAYKVAAENNDLQHYKDILAEHQRMIEEEIQAQEEREAAKAAKKSKGKRKSTAAKDEDEDVDMADSPDVKPKSAKKRKKDVDSDGEGVKPAKTPKTGTKLKLTTGTPKTPQTGKGKKAAESAKGAKSKGKKSAEKAPVSDDDDDEEMAESPKESEKTEDPTEAKKREQKILFLRHKLQRGFLARDQEPKAEEMDAMSDHLADLENYVDLEVGIMRSTKINKVLKGIIKLTTIPREEEFQFKNRSVELLKKWKSLLESDAPAKEGEKEEAGEKDEAKETPVKEDSKDSKDAEEAESKPTENGVEKDVNGKTEEATTKEGDEDVEMSDAGDAAPAKADAPESTEKTEEPPKEAEAAATEPATEAETAKA